MRHEAQVVLVPGWLGGINGCKESRSGYIGIYVTVISSGVMVRAY